jgi:glutamate/tyrosine decarboxylase-like PLP-dependent enzyme
MNSRLAQLHRQLAEPLPHPNPAELEDMAGQIVAWLMQHHASLPEQAVARTGTRPQMESLLREPPPEAGQGFRQAFTDFQEKVAPNAFRVNHPRFLAFIPGAPTYVSVLGDMLCAGTNFFAGVWLEAAGPAQVEILVLDWFKQFLGFPPEARGVLTSGGSEANLTALVTAREPLSFADRHRAVLYVTEQRHLSMDRAAKVIGLQPEQVQRVPTSEHFALNPQALADLVQRDRAAGRLPWAVAANAGATNTGTVDPLATLADFCRRERLWFHVDAAYGWPAVLTPEGGTLLDGIGQADSITLDPHKWFGQAFEAGCVLVRDGRLLGDTFKLRPDYMQDVAPADDEINFCDHGIALTRRFRALKIWFSVKVLGVAWFRSLVERCCRLAEFGEGLLRQTPGFEILSPRQLSIVCFRYVPLGRERSAAADEYLNRLNLLLVDALRATGRAFLSSTVLRGQVALRFCFVNWRTTAADVEEIVRLLSELGENLAQKKV